MRRAAVLAAAVLATRLGAGPASGGEAAQEAPAPQLAPIAPRLAMSAAMTLPQRQEAYQRGPALAFGAGVYLLAWQDGYNGLGGNSDILALRLGADGRPLDKKPLQVCADQAVQDSPAAAFCAGRFVVAWADFRNGKDYDVYAREVGADGKLGPELLLAGGKGGQARPALAAGGADAFLAVWQDHRGGKEFQVFGARVAAPEGQALKPQEGQVLLENGEAPAAAWNGKGYLVTVGRTGRLVGEDGAPAGGPLTLWSGRKSEPPAAAFAFGRAFAFFNTSPFPDPWGWGANGAIIGVGVTSAGASPEFGAAKHGWYDLAKDQANRTVKNAVAAARWRNHNDWPMGMPGGFKGSHDDAWPSGPVAAAFNGRSLLVAWCHANFVDRLRLSNRDLYLKRVLDGWAYVDEPGLKIVAGPTEETAPALAAGAPGEALLAYERQLPEGGIAVEYRLLREEEDRQPPRLCYAARESATKLVLVFDEPLDAGSASRAENYALEGAAVRSAAFVRDNSALQREVALETEAPLTPGKTYALAVKGVKDLAGNAAAGEPVEHLCQPGLSQRSDFIERWLVLGRFPADWESAYVDPAAARPSPGQAVPALAEEKLKADQRKALGEEEWAKGNWEARCAELFGGEKKWQAAEGVQRCLLRLSQFYGKTPMAAACAHTYVYSDREREVLVRVDSNDGNETWLNGERVCSDRVKAGRGIHEYTNEAPAKLKKGWNRLLIRVHNHIGLWLLVAQITDRDRQPIRSLTWQLEDPAAEGKAAAPAERY